MLLSVQTPHNPTCCDAVKGQMPVKKNGTTESPEATQKRRACSTPKLTRYDVQVGLGARNSLTVKCRRQKAGESGLKKGGIGGDAGKDI